MSFNIPLLSLSRFLSSPAASKSPSEDYDEEREMEPRPEPARAVTPPLRAASPRVHRKTEGVVEFEETQNKEESRVERNSEGGRPSENSTKREWRSKCLFPSPLGSVTPFIRWIEDYPLPDRLKMPSHIGSYDGKGDPDNFLYLFEGAIRMQKWKLMQSNIQTLLPKVETINQISSSGLQYSHRGFFGRRFMAVGRNIIRSHNWRRSRHDHEDTYIHNHKVKEYQEKDIIRTKPDQIKKKREAWRSPKESKAVSVSRARKTEQDEDPPEVLMADNRTMVQLLQAPTVGYEDAIVIPEITATNFELKHGLINLVQNKQFFEHDKEDP
nr:reverse transcriptase domain-containing protein [Tanacetum cinerariifolium]